jgi:hypothetical protein
MSAYEALCDVEGGGSGVRKGARRVAPRKQSLTCVWPKSATTQPAPALILMAASTPSRASTSGPVVTKAFGKASVSAECP